MCVLHQPDWPHLEACQYNHSSPIYPLTSQIDIVVLKRLAEVVNVVPVIAKSDSLTLEERALFKERVS